MTQPEASAQNSQNTTTSGTTNGNPNAPTNATSTTTEEILYSAFRQKTIDMKHWVPLPDSMPSNRDRLELYALHRQAVSGDAPAISASNNQQWNATDRAKYNAWKSKAGLSTTSAMQQYIQEADRQVRVYGTSPATSAVQSKNINGGVHSNDTAQSGSYSTQQQQQPQSHSHPPPPPPTSRGLAAIPLLCAAASEQRVSYLRRIQTTSYHNAWWKRQEPLLAPPFTILAIPEHILLYIATGVETISLYVTYTHITNEPSSAGPPKNTNTTTTNTTGSNALASSSSTKTNTTTGGNSHNTTLLPHAVGVTIQSYLWPFHNVLLSTWMTVILIYMITSTSIQCLSTILLGSRRTGLTLHTIYYEQIVFISQSIYTIMESHQPVSVRCIGLLFLPYTFLLRVLHTINPTLTATTTPDSTMAQPPDATSSSNRNSSFLVTCSVYSILIGMTLWYWMWLVPCVVIFGMDYVCSILLLGPCFAIIELASQL